MKTAPEPTMKVNGIRALVQEAIQSSFSRIQFDAEQWTMEVRAIAQAAAVEGDYGIALEAYKMLGRHVGATVDAQPANTQHVHVHQGPLDDFSRKEATDEELQLRMDEIRAQQKKLMIIDTPAEVVETSHEAPEEQFFES